MRILIAIFSLSLAVFALSLNEIKSKIKTGNIDGNFTQTKILSGFSNKFKIYGEFWLRQNELIWKTSKPISSTIVINESGIFEKNGDNLVNIGQNFDKKLFLSIIKLDIKELEKEFEILNLTAQNGWKIELKPKNILFKQIFKSIAIYGDEFVSKIELFETSGDETINEFYNIR